MEVNNINGIKHISECNDYEFIRYKDLLEDVIPNDILTTMQETGDERLFVAMLPEYILSHFSDSYILNVCSYTNASTYRKLYRTMIDATLSVFIMSIMRYYRDNESMFVYKKEEEHTDAKTAFALSLVEQKYLFTDMVKRVLRYVSIILNKVGLRQAVDSELYRHVNGDPTPNPDKFVIYLDDPHRHVATYEFTTDDTDKIMEFLEDTGIIDALVFSETKEECEYDKETNIYTHIIRIKRNVRDKYFISKFCKDDIILALLEA